MSDVYERLLIEGKTVIRGEESIENLRWRKVQVNRMCCSCTAAIPKDTMRFMAEETLRTRHYCVSCGKKWGWDVRLGVKKDGEE